MHGVMCIGKRVNAQVRNYDLRDMDNEMNKKIWNFIEINELSGWSLAPLRKWTGQFMVVKSIRNWHVHC